MSYDPTEGRWISADPAGYVDGGNLYEAVGGQPVSRLDPSGLKWIGRRPLTPKEKDRLKTYTCVMNKMGASFSKAVLDALISTGKVQIGTNTDPSSLGETDSTGIVLDSRIFNDPILGPSVLLHEYTHYSNFFSDLGISEWWYNIKEKFGSNETPEYIAGDGIINALNTLNKRMRGDGGRTSLDKLYCDCGDSSKCKKPPTTCPSTQPTSQPK